MLIYGLIDPRDNEIKYIGFTSKSAGERLKGHRNERGLTPKNNWFKKLKSLNLAPESVVLERVTERNWRERERSWIAYVKEIGFDSKNYLPGGEHGPILKGVKQKPKHIKNAALSSRKLTQEQEEEIREGYREGETQVKLSAKYNVSRHTVMRVINGRNNSFETRKRGKISGVRELTNEQVAKIKDLVKSGEHRQKDIAKKFNTCSHTVCRIASGKRYNSSK